MSQPNPASSWLTYLNHHKLTAVSIALLITWSIVLTIHTVNIQNSCTPLLEWRTPVEQQILPEKSSKIQKIVVVRWLRTLIRRDKATPNQYSDLSPSGDCVNEPSSGGTTTSDNSGETISKDCKGKRDSSNNCKDPNPTPSRINYQEVVAIAAGATAIVVAAAIGAPVAVVASAGAIVWFAARTAMNLVN